MKIILKLFLLFIITNFVVHASEENRLIGANPRTIIKKSFEYLDEKSLAVVVHSDPQMQHQFLEKNLYDYWDFLKKAELNLASLISSRTEQDGYTSLKLSAQEHQRIKYLLTKYKLTEEVVEFGLASLPEWLEEQYVNITNEVLKVGYNALTNENKNTKNGNDDDDQVHESQMDKYSFLGPEVSRLGVIGYFVQNQFEKNHGHKRYLYRRKECPEQLSLRLAISQNFQENMQSILVSLDDAVIRPIDDVKQMNNEEERELDYIIIPARDVNNQQIINVIGKSLKNNEELKLIVACDDQETVIPDNFLKPLKNLKKNLLVVTGLHISKIGNGFLYFDPNLKKVDLSGFVKIEKIGYGFLSYCTGLEEVKFSKIFKVKKTGKTFFYESDNLTYFRGFLEIEEIGDRFLAFYDGLEEVKFSKIFKIKKIGNHFLYCCRNLKKIDLSGFLGIEAIGDGFLSYCFGLEELKFSKILKVKKIGNHFLNGCFHLKKIDLSGFIELEEIGDSFLTNRLEEVKFPEQSKVKKIGRNFIFGCGLLKELDLSGFTEVEEIGDRFLSFCTNLEKIILSEKLYELLKKKGVDLKSQYPYASIEIKKKNQVTDEFSVEKVSDKTKKNYNCVIQ